MHNKKNIEQSIIWACEQEVRAPKPGNVNSWCNGHNMQLQDFILSAHAIAPCLTQPSLSIGERILHAIKATQDVVHCNTNLGIVLLFAPLCKAVAQASSFDQIKDELAIILNNLTIEDAKNTYAAIRMAQAGGLGKEKEHDINDEPVVTLRQSMEVAQGRDLIAAQYVNNYQHIFHIGLPKIISAINCGESIEWATTLAYLYLLSESYDTLICRKHGVETADLVSEKARYFIKKLNDNNSLKNLTPELAAWDKELKRNAINPGTTADLVAASLLLYAFSSK